MTMRIAGPWFVDDEGRRLILRGVNLGGSSKVPARPDGATHLGAGFADHRAVSFVGRPFPLEEADEHFARLRRWGCNVLRFLVTWEAIEHAGPGIYDEEYLAYVAAVVAKAGEHGLKVFIDPHQDVWSRFTGGDGAPGWTLEAAGLDVAGFHATRAAILHHEWGDAYPRMIWSTNSTKLACATLFTLFFGGNAFAPGVTVDGVPIQDFLQDHYLGAVAQVARRLRGLDCVVGYDTLNEPYPGWIGWPDLAAHHDRNRRGEMPTPFQALLLGSGLPQSVDVWRVTPLGLVRSGRRRIDPAGARAWLPGRECIWRAHGVWDQDARGEPRLLRPDYFAQVGGRAVDFYEDFFRPFLHRFAAAVRAEDPEAILFVEGLTDAASLAWDARIDPGNVAHAPHWYDVLTLITKRFTPWFTVDVDGGGIRPALGRRSVRRSFARQLGRIKAFSAERMGNIPTLIGESGVPFDLDDKRAYRDGDFSGQIEALDGYYAALDEHLLSATLWNYTPDNRNAHGDLWNEEDLSIFSRDQQTDPQDPDAGGRGLEAVVRPYAPATAGEPLAMRFDRASGRFEFEFRHDAAVSAPTEIFVPRRQYPGGARVTVSDGTYELDEPGQRLLYRHDPGRAIHRITLERR